MPPSISSVSGTLAEGQTITITGTGFGATGPTVLVFDDFSKGSNGNPVATGAGSAVVGKWDYNHVYPAKYSNAYAHSGSLSLMSDWSDNGAAEGGRFVLIGQPYTADFSANGGVFFSWWMYLPSNRVEPGASIGMVNWKIYWIFKWQGTHALQGSDYIAGLIDYVPTSNGWFDGPVNDNGSPARLGSNWTSFPFTKGKWWRFDNYIKEAQDNTGILQFWQMADGHARDLHVNLSGGPTEHGLNSTPPVDPPEVWDAIKFPGYAYGDVNSQTYYDDIYVATGPGAQARVEIGNASTLAACTNMSIATVTSWSDTFATATVRAGSFSPIVGNYLYVFDANGNANATGFLLVGGSPTQSLVGAYRIS